MKRLIALALLCLGVTVQVGAAPLNSVILQTALPLTGAQTTIVVSDATNIAINDILFVDAEVMLMVSKSTDTLTVARAYQGTAQSVHAIGAVIYTGPQTAFATTNPTIGASCTSSAYTPLINIRNAQFYQCLTGKWSRVIPPLQSVGQFIATPTFSNLSLGNTGAVNTKYPDGQTLLDVIDLRQTWTDLSTDFAFGQWTYIVADPAANVAGELYGNNLEVRTVAGNSKTITRIEGADSAVYTPSSGAIGTVVGSTHSAIIGYPTGGGTVTLAQGARNKVSVYNSGVVTTAYGSWNQVANVAAGTMGEGNGTWSHVENDGAGVITTATAHRVSAPVNSGGGHITNLYGEYFEDQTLAGTTLNYQLYSAGNLHSFFAGPMEFSADVAIGTTTPLAGLPVGAVSGRTLMINAAANDAVVSLRAAASTLEGVDIWYDVSVPTTYFDSRWNNPATSIVFRTRTLGSPQTNLTLIGDGSVSMDSLKTTGSAGTKKVVCVDTATGKLYASSTSTDCSN